MNRSKLDSAKIKLSKLKEKYFNTEVSPGNKKSSGSYSSPSSSEVSVKADSYKNVKNDVMKSPVRSQYMCTRKSNDSENLLSKPKAIDKYSLSLLSNQTFSNAGETDPGHTDDSKSSQQSPKSLSSVSSVRSSKPSTSDRFDQRKQFSTVSQPGSTILSELSNKFENINFLSSSSNDQSLNQDDNFVSKANVKENIETNIYPATNQVLIMTPKLETEGSLPNMLSKRSIELTKPSTTTNLKVSSPSTVQSVEEIEQLGSLQVSLHNYNSDFESDNYSSPEDTLSVVKKNSIEKQADFKYNTTVSTFEHSHVKSPNEAFQDQPKRNIHNKTVELPTKEAVESSFIPETDRPKQNRERVILSQISKVSLQQKSNIPRRMCANKTTSLNEHGERGHGLLEKELKPRSSKKATQTDFPLQIPSSTRRIKQKPKRQYKNNAFEISMNPSKRQTLKSCILFQNTETSTVDGFKSRLENLAIGESVYNFINGKL